MAKSSRPAPRNVLITRFSALGDVAMTVPVVYPVCRANPDVNFVLVTRPGPATMMINRPANLTVVGVDLKKYRGITGPMRLAANLRHRYDIDALADLHSVIRTRLMALRLRLMGVRVATIHKGRAEKRRLTSGKLRQPIDTTFTRYSRVFSALGLKTGGDFRSIFDNAAQPPASPIVPPKAPDERWIAVAPFSQHRGKVYPMEQMRLVIDELVTWPGCRIFLFGGGEQEKRELLPIAEKYDNATSVAHIPHTFADELALLARCDVMLTMDSANMHLASLTATPVVSVWGATHPWVGFMGWQQAMKDTVQLPLDCRPCSVYGNKPCRYGDYRCLTQIDPEMITNKVKKVLER